jgi:hypothetical protein
LGGRVTIIELLHIAETIQQTTINDLSTNNQKLSNIIMWTCFRVQKYKKNNLKISML